MTNLFDVLDVMKSQLDGRLEQARRDVFRDEFEAGGHKWLVDTVCSVDAGWETGILKDEGKWLISAYYDDRAAAKIGHEKFVADIKANPEMELPNVQTIGLFSDGDMEDDEA